MKIVRTLVPATALALSAQLLLPRSAPARQSAIARTPHLRLLSMVSPTAGWALDTSAVVRTADGGVLWVDRTPPGVVVTQSSMLFSLNVRTTWLTAMSGRAASPVLARTTDGGQIWRSYPLPIPGDAARIGGVTFIDPSHGWLLISLGAGAGSEGVQVLRTTDGGAHWATVSRTATSSSAPGSLPLGGIKTGIAFHTATTGWATAAVAGPTGFAWLYRTRDGGSTWQHQGLALPRAYRQGAPIVYPPRFFTSGGGMLPVILHTPAATASIDFYTTRDGGATWSSTTPLPFKASAGSPNWDFGDRNHGWVTWGDALRATGDGGRTWRTIGPNPGGQAVGQLDFVNARTGWSLGTSAGTPLRRTADGGHTWVRLSPYVTYPPSGSVHIQATGG